MTTERPSWDEYFLQLAELAATRSTCSRLSVGAVLVGSISHRVLATGYNGVPSGQPHCVHVDDLPCRKAIHAEANALARTTESYWDTTLYISHSPCDTCQGLIVATGVSRVIFRKPYRLTSLDRLIKAGIQLS